MTKPKLSIFVGESQISGLKYISPKDYEFFSYPYVPLDSLTHDISGKFKANFLNQFISEFVTGKEGINPNDFDIIVGDLNGIGDYGEGVTHANILGALSSIHNYSWFMVEDFTIATPSDFISYFPFSEFKNDENFINFFSNKTLYSQMVSRRREEYDMEEKYLQKISDSIQHKFNSEIPVLFTGDRFFGAHRATGLLYISALGFLKAPGIYELMMDTANKLPAMALLNQTFQQTSGEEGRKVGMLTEDILDGNYFNNEFVTVGTVLKSQGRAECLFEKEGSSPQFVEIEKDEMFILPLEKNETARVSISTGKLGKIEKKITGGDVGFIIDTRVSKSNQFNPEWVEIFEERLNSF